MTRRDFMKKLLQIPVVAVLWPKALPRVSTPESFSFGGWFHQTYKGWHFEPYQASFDGHIAAVEFYPHALSDKEIADLYIEMTRGFQP